jgi:hypothetical protein
MRRFRAPSGGGGRVCSLHPAEIGGSFRFGPCATMRFERSGFTISASGADVAAKASTSACSF